MAGGNTIDLFAHWPAKDLGAAFLTTFTFNAPFFELHLLPELLRRGAHPVVVLVDRDEGYEAATTCAATLGAAGRDYHLVAVQRVGGVFHPKVHLFTGAGVAFVGSGNLTPSGCGGNLEAFDVVRAGEDGSAVRAVRAFFRDLLSDASVLAKDEVREHLLSLLPERADPPNGGEASFLHTLAREPLRPRLRKVIVEDAYTNALLAAPFHDQDHHTSLAIRDLLGAPRTKLAAEPTAAPPTPPKSLARGALEDEANRRLHAKVIHAVGRESSLCVVGSANLTRPAWDGDNVEAIVVRQQLSRDAFDAFFGAASFDPSASWTAANPPEKLPPGLPRTPLRWASLRGDVLTAEVADVGQDGEDLADLCFELEVGHTSLPIEMRRQRADTWTGRMPNELQQLHRAALLRATADAHAPTVVLIGQVDRQFLRPREARMRDAIAQMGDGAVDEETRRDLLACLGELFGAMGAKLQVDKPAQAEADVRSGGDRREPPEKDPDDVVREVESLVYGATAPRTLVGRMNHLLAIVDLVTGNDPKDEAGGGHWRPEMLDQARRAATPSQPPAAPGATGAPPRAPTAGDTTTTEEPEEPEESEEIDRVPGHIVDAAFALARRLRGVLPAFVSRDPDGAVVVYATSLRLLANLAVQCHSRVGECVPILLDMLEDGFAVAEWPSRAQGYWLSLSAGPLPGCDEAELASLICVEVTKERSTRALDVAKRVALGAARLSASADGSAGQGPRRQWALPFGVSRDALRTRVAAHRTRGEMAHEVLEPLWKLEYAWSAIRALRDKRADVEKTRGRHAAVCKELVPRNVRHKEAAAQIALLDVELRSLDERLVALVALEADARTAAQATSPLPLVLAPSGPPDGPSVPLSYWERTPPKRTAGSVRRLVPARGTACSACNMELRPSESSKLEDPRALVRCVHCNVLIAAGPPEGLFDG